MTHKQMKTKVLALALISLAAMTSFSGCAGCANDMKQMHASFTGLHKKITLYGNDGKAIREWTTTTATNDQGGSCFFLTSDGKAVTISGTFVIEEIP